MECVSSSYSIPNARLVSVELMLMWAVLLHWHSPSIQISVRVKGLRKLPTGIQMLALSWTEQITVFSYLQFDLQSLSNFVSWVTQTGQLPHGGSHRSEVLPTVLREFWQVFLPLFFPKRKSWPGGSVHSPQPQGGSRATVTCRAVCDPRPPKQNEPMTSRHTRFKCFQDRPLFLKEFIRDLSHSTSLKRKSWPGETHEPPPVTLL